MLTDDLLARAAAPGVELVELIPTADCAVFRAHVDDDVLELTTSVDREAVAAVVREIAARVEQDVIPMHVSVLCPTGQVSLGVELRRNVSGWIVELRPDRIPDVDAWRLSGAA
jgi:hypothetical protein